MWSALRALAARVGLSRAVVESVERNGKPATVQDPLNERIGYKVRPDPDWALRMGEAWEGTLVNSRREFGGLVPVEDGMLSVVGAELPHDGVTTRVIPGNYEISLIVAHLGREENGDYEEHVSHAFAVLQGRRDVSSIAPLTDENGTELGVEAYGIAFASDGVLPKIAGNHAGRWSLRLVGLFHPKNPDGTKASLKSVRIENEDGAGAAVFLHGGTGRNDYPLFKIADVDGNTIGVMADFFVDNRPW